MAMSYIKFIFTYVPYAVLVLTFLLFVRRMYAGWKPRTVLSLWLVFCCSKFLMFDMLGGNVFVPDFPVWLIWFWNWAYSGAVILCVFSVVLPFRFRFKSVALPFAAWSLSAWGLWCGVRPPSVHAIELDFPDLPQELDGYRIVHLSDLHASTAARQWRTQSIVDAVNGLRPDLICLTGDYVDGRFVGVADVLTPLRNLCAKDGVWAVTGNHEWFEGHQSWWRRYEAMGIRFLVNECAFPRRTLALGGGHDFCVRNRKTGKLYDWYPDVEDAFSSATNGEFRILLQHQPCMAPTNFARHGVRLQLSGHTHGGIMPILSILVGRANNGFVRGLYRCDDCALYVNPGCGQWAGFPMRFFDPSEIAVLTLRKRGER